MSEQLAPRPSRPLSKLQDYLVETKSSIRLLRDVLVEVKELLVVAALILLFALGVYEAVLRLLI
jgi:hypothetical protein